MNRSQRHHYIPQFLINNFADEEGFVWIYDKQYKSCKKKGPNAVFFEMNRNTTHINGQPNDFLEKMYAGVDDMAAKELTELLKTKNVTVEQLTNILFLLNTLKWRIPLNDFEFNSLKDELTYEKLPIRINIKGTDIEAEKSALDHLTNSELFNESKRLIFAVLPFYADKMINDKQLLPIVNKSYLNSNETTNALLGDVPYIERGEMNVSKFNEVIFPLSKTDTFIYSESGKKISDIRFYVYRDLVIFHQAQKYVVSSSESHIHEIVASYEHAKSKGFDQFMNDAIFELI